ncbi:hypothetical protein N9289_00500 [Candidatus Poseidonia sp.]|nr:hypothetical protein [Poseidonia sp.]
MRQIFGSIQHSSIVNIGHIHLENISFQLTLWGFNGNTTFSCYPANGNFRDSTEKCIIGSIITAATKSACHDLRSRVDCISTSCTEMGWKLSPPQGLQGRLRQVIGSLKAIDYVAHL